MDVPYFSRFLQQASGSLKGLLKFLDRVFPFPYTLSIKVIFS